VEDLLGFLAEQGKAWVLSQREEHRKRGTALSPPDAQRLGRYFEPETLEPLRVCTVEKIANPPFYAELEKAGIAIPMDLRQMEGITFLDTVVVAARKMAESSRISLLFHESVHAAQYRLLGLDRFLEAYVRGWAENGRDYFSIPLEREAYALQVGFETGGNHPFSVEQAIRRRLELRPMES
jgi:hypothetical protein